MRHATRSWCPQRPRQLTAEDTCSRLRTALAIAARRLVTNKTHVLLAVRHGGEGDREEDRAEMVRL